MSAKLKYRKDRGAWIVRCHQHSTRWSITVANAPTGRAIANRINARMRAGEDMRPTHTRPARAARVIQLLREHVHGR